MLSPATLKIAISLIILPVFFFISWRDKRWGVFIVLFSLPAYLIRYPIPIPGNLLEALILILFLIITFEAIQTKKIKAIFQLLFKTAKREKILSAAVFLILIGVLASSFISTDLKTSLGIVRGWFLVPLLFSFCYYLIAANQKNKKLFLKKALLSLSYSGLALAWIAIFYALLGKFTFDGRLAAFFQSPNQLAMFLVPAFLFYVFLAERGYFKYFNLLVFLVPLVLTYSLGTIGGLAGGVILGGYFYNKKESSQKYLKRFGTYFALFFGVLLIIIALNTDLLVHFQNVISRKIASSQSRIVIWRSALRILKNNWFLGIGPGVFQQKYLQYQEFFPAYPEWAVPQPHNIYLAFWLQSGLLGILGFLGTIGWFFKTIFYQLKNKFKQTLNKKITACLFAVITYTLIHGLVDTPYWRNDLAVIFWVTVTSLLIMTTLKLNTPTKTQV